MRTSSERQNLSIIQALRGLAAIWVVLFHADEGGHIANLASAMPPLMHNLVFKDGHYGVSIFFALSGFVISYGLANKDITLTFFKIFVIKRAIRLDPTYWISIIIAILFMIVSALVKNENIIIPSFANIICHMFYLQIIMQQPEINAVYWTLTYEVQFYLFLVSTLMLKTLIMKNANRYYSLLFECILFTIAILSSLNFFDNIHPGVFLPLWPCFYIGVLANYSKTSKLALASMLGLFLLMTTQSSFYIISGITALLIYISIQIGWAHNGLNWRWLQFLGTISYSLYLIHNPVTGAAGFLSKKILGTGSTVDLLTLFIILISSVSAAYLLWFTVERKTHRLSRSIS